MSAMCSALATMDERPRLGVGVVLPGVPSRIARLKLGATGLSFLRLQCIALVFALLAGCEIGRNLPDRVDYVSFETLGGTVLSSPKQVTLKEVHLDSASLVGNTVIVEGEVLEVNSHGTFLILDDASARMLIVLTELTSQEQLQDKRNVKRMKILGTVESGKRGLPFIQARALKIEGPTQG